MAELSLPVRKLERLRRHHRITLMNAKTITTGVAAPDPDKDGNPIGLIVLPLLTADMSLCTSKEKAATSGERRSTAWSTHSSNRSAALKPIDWEWPLRSFAPSGSSN